MKLLLLIVGLSLVSAKQGHCTDCQKLFEGAFTLLEDDTIPAQEVADSLCNKTAPALTAYCTDLSNRDEVDFGELLSSKQSIADICIAIKQCEMPELPPPAAPVEFHTAGKEQLEKTIEQRTQAIREESKIQMQTMQDLAASMKPTINVAAPPPSGSGSGLAWDKHDFDVTNNKGGDVQVEVNLAAPMTSSSSSSEGSFEDIAPLVEALVQSRNDEPDPYEMMKMMMNATRPQIDVAALVRQLMPIVQQPQPVPDDSDQIQQLLNGVMDAMKEMNRRQQAPPPPPPQQVYDIPAIIESLQPAPAPVQPPIDVAALMREMRAAIEAGQQPPPPPPGLDPGLLDMMKQMMKDMRDMAMNANKEHSQPPPPPPTPILTLPPSPGQIQPGNNPFPLPPSQPLPSQQAPAAPPQLPPPPPPPPTRDDLRQELDAAIRALQASMPSVKLPPFPASPDSEMEALKSLLAKQLNAASKPIILPPPVAASSVLHAESLAPPPPPPPPTSDVSREDLMALIRAQTARPQRIPAPPVIHQEQQNVPSPCCAAPAPNERRPDQDRCPKVNGLPLPRCKRPPPTTVKCRKRRCNVGKDADGDFDVDVTNDLPYCEGECEDGLIPHDSFNPKALLEKLCPKGNCGAPAAPIHTHTQVAS